MKNRTAIVWAMILALVIFSGGILTGYTQTTSTPVLTFPDLFAPAAAETAAAQTWVTTVQNDLIGHETRLQGINAQEQADVANLNAQIAVLQQEIAALKGSATTQPATFTTPVISYSSISGGPQQPVCGNILCNTQTGEMISYAITGLAPGNYSVSFTAAGPGTAAIRVNNRSNSGVLIFNGTGSGASVPITWPGGSGTVSIVILQSWLNIQGNILIQ